MNTIGSFNDAKKEYKIENMFPPRTWLNYLWNENVIAAIDQFGCGASWHFDKQGNRSELCGEGDSRLLFIKDESNGSYFSANRNFDKENFQHFNTDVGMGYSTIKSKYKDIQTSFRITVPQEGNFELWTVTVENSSSEDKNLSLVSFADADVNRTGHHAYNGADFDPDLQGILLGHHGYDIGSDYPYAVFAADVKADTYETSKKRFKGAYGSMHHPEALSNGDLSSIGATFDKDMIGALQFKMNLKAGEKKTINFILALCQSPADAKKIVSKNLSLEAIEVSLAQTKEKIDSSFDTIWIDTPDAETNSMLNIWLKQQISLGKTWGRGYTKGFRDIMQDITGFVATDPEKAKEKIIYCLQRQFSNGNTLRQWEPVLNHPYVDGASWIVPAVVCYLKETGDIAFLQEEVQYLTKDLDYYSNGEDRILEASDDYGTILDHCVRGMNFLYRETGARGMCLWGGGDWNDSLNAAGLKGKGESVWLSQATIKSTNEFVELLEYIGEHDLAHEYTVKAIDLGQNIVKNGFEKDHFICGINDWDEKIGSWDNEKGQIYLNMQTWAVLAEIIPKESGHNLLDLVEKELKCPFGYVLSKPSYIQGDDHIGRVAYMEKGSYENGSVYNHGVAFKIAADCKLGRGNLAYESVKMMFGENPDNSALKSGTEPYAVTNMFLGPENDFRVGESIYGWITGTAGWMLRCISEFMIGVNADYEGLLINPCLPERWKELSIKRVFRGTTYNIAIENPQGLETGSVAITLNGITLEGNTIPDQKDGGEHEVVITLSPKADSTKEEVSAQQTVTA